MPVKLSEGLFTSPLSARDTWKLSVSQGERIEFGSFSRRSVSVPVFVSDVMILSASTSETDAGPSHYDQNERQIP